MKVPYCHADLSQIGSNAIDGADSRADCTAGSSRPTSRAMIEMTTNNSISVNADRG